MALERYHRGACVLPDRELRITQRCLTDDLKLAPGSSFAAAAAHPIVKAFEEKRETDTGSGKTVGPAAAPDAESFHHLGAGNDHRGATWFQPAVGVVWLCAYGFHRSGTANDFFKWAVPMAQDGSLLPTRDDIRLLLRERGLRFRDMAPVHGRELLKQARGRHQIVTDQLAWEVDVRVKVEAAGADELVSVAFPASAAGRSNDLVSAFDPKQRLTPDWSECIPGEAPVPGEIVFTVLREPSDQ